jgi:23S rRNA-/tRNA-specific pseudouridylate synthase
MFFPKTRRAASHVARLLMEGKVEKVYWAMIPGVPREPGWTVDAPVASLGKSRFGVARGGRQARTAFRVLSEGKGASLLEARPITGRTHQIRVHLAHCGVPVIGDERYAGSSCQRMILHCRRMSFRPESGNRIAATAPVDAPFREVCARYGISLEENR